MADARNQDADENARNRAVLEEYDRDQSMRARYASFAARQQNLAGNAEQVSPQGNGQDRVSPQGRGQLGSPLPPLRLGNASQQPAAPQFATDTAATLAAVSQAMQAVAAAIGDRSANNSRGRDDFVIPHSGVL